MDWVDEVARGVRARLVWGLLAAVGVTVLVSPATVLGALPADVAVIAGKPISRQVFDHWMVVSAKGANGPGAPAIAPTDPPRFSRCVARVRAVIPSLRRISSQTLRADCAQLFTDMSGEVLDFLIRADWQAVEASRDRIVVTAAQVTRTYEVDRREDFRTPARFRRYLRRSGETVADVRYRVRVSLIYQALLKTEHLTAGALDTELASRFKPQTSCARFYVVSDCTGGSRPGPGD